MRDIRTFNIPVTIAIQICPLSCVKFYICVIVIWYVIVLSCYYTVSLKISYTLHVCIINIPHIHTTIPITLAHIQPIIPTLHLLCDSRLSTSSRFVGLDVFDEVKPLAAFATNG